MGLCKPKGKKEKIRQYRFAKNMFCEEMQNEMYWRMARLREWIARGIIKY